MFLLLKEGPFAFFFMGTNFGMIGIISEPTLQCTLSLIGKVVFPSSKSFVLSAPRWGKVKMESIFFCSAFDEIFPRIMLNNPA